jgi:hypothetical protein
MAGITIDSTIHVNAMVEVNKIRKAIDPYPFDGLVLCVTLSNGLQQRTVGPDLRMASHTDLSRWEACKRRLLYRGVTKLAIDS